MSLTTLPPRTHPVLAALRALNDDLDELAAANLWSLSDSEALAVRVQLEALASRLTSAKWQSTRDIDVRGAAVAAGATSMTAWLVNVLRQHPGDAAREVRLAAQMTDITLPATSASLAAGEITPAAAGAIADTDRALAAQVN